MKQQGKNKFDWDAFWEEPSDIDEMEEGARRMAQRLTSFMDNHPITNLADFGCGPALTLFQLAREWPDVAFHGFDTSIWIIEQNRECSEKEGLNNLFFEQDALPNLSTQNTFDVVVCIATLHYVREIRKAVLNLFDRVVPGGYLIFNYPNRYTMYAYQRWVREGGSIRRKRFELVLSGENLLTLKEISNILGTGPHNFWKYMDEESPRANICIYVKRKCLL